MNTKRQFERNYTKYVVKSPLLFSLYFGLFLAVSLGMSFSLKLDVRKAYGAELNGNIVQVQGGSEINFLKNEVYIYADKNQEVFTFEIIAAEHRDGIMYITINEPQIQLAGEVTLEAITDRTSLFLAIFAKAGVQR